LLQVSFKISINNCDSKKKLLIYWFILGHYCQLGGTLEGPNSTFLLRGLDNKKDQSYFLAAVNWKALQKVQKKNSIFFYSFFNFN